MMHTFYKGFLLTRHKGMYLVKIRDNHFMFNTITDATSFINFKQGKLKNDRETKILGYYNSAFKNAPEGDSGSGSASS